MVQRLRRSLDRTDELEIFFEPFGGRHEDIQHSVAGLGAHGGTREIRGRFFVSRLPVWRGVRTAWDRGIRASRYPRCVAGATPPRHPLQLPADLLCRRQRREGLIRICYVHVRIVAGRHPGQRVERQPVTQRRIAGDQIATLAAQKPGTAAPLAARRIPPDRQHVPDRVVQPELEDLRQALALLLVFQSRIERVHVDRQLALAPEVIEGVLERREDILGRQPQRPGHGRQKLLGRLRRRAVAARLVGDEVRIHPHRLAVAAPEAVQRPPRQRLARIPLALPEVRKPGGRVAILESVIEVAGQPPLVRSESRCVPLSAVGIVAGHEGRLAAHGQPHVAGFQFCVDPLAQRLDGRPGFRAVRLGDPRCLPHPLDPHAMFEFHLAVINAAAHGRGRRGRRCTSERDVSLASQQARGRIEPDPPCTRQIHFAPRVQIREVHFGTRRSVERFHVRRELNQVARHEPGRQPQVAQKLDQQPAGIPAGARGLLECVFGCLHPRLHPDEVADFLRQTGVEIHEEVDGADFLPWHRGQELREPRRCGQPGEIRRKLPFLLLFILERIVVGVRLEEEVEGVVHRHLGDQIHLDPQLAGLFRKGQPRQVVRLRILLPVEEVLRRLDLQ